MRRVRFFQPWVALAMLVCVATVCAQSKGIDPALLAKAKAGDADAENQIALKYSRLGNEKESCRWMLMAGQNGNVEAQMIIAEDYEHGNKVCGIQEDALQTVVWLRKAATGGNGVAAEELASHYYDGKGAPQDYLQAALWWRKAAEIDYPDAELNLGLMYYNGDGVAQDFGEAARWFEKAAVLRLGNTSAAEWERKVANDTTARAAYFLGRIYAYGQGVPRNITESLNWFTKASDLGSVDAENELGLLYTGIGGFPRDDSSSATWYRKAADHGDAQAQDNLGSLYEYGRGVPQDYAEAYFWYSLGAAQIPAFSRDRDNVASNLTKTVLLQTQERARKWFEDHPVQKNPQ